jgi:hypothetical protein
MVERTMPLHSGKKMCSGGAIIVMINEELDQIIIEMLIPDRWGMI